MFYPTVKRVLDLIAAFILLIICLPIMLIIALLIKVDSKGPILYKQKRVGKDNKVFTIYKFRTMIVETNRDGRQLSDFERMTRLGRFLRLFSLDELPQLFNIIKGEMSFVGPRPLLVEYLEYYDEYQLKRHKVLPGITGWAQVNGRNLLSWEERFKYDVWYVENMSFMLDLKIILLTLIKVLKKEGVNSSDYLTMPRFDEIMASKKGEKIAT
ncbi:sugar transferase [Caldicellulosiruptor morganii]|uniref:Sugar transferase n=1 Tax=Caldicellulosiruptor morganii TaxID=1387555 RepID=A0ABY7BQA0_9FIRM|nr:sugar transferase [Caldicellulosiruptor morganii]